MSLRLGVDLYAHIAPSEGVVPFLYKDSKGFATCGVGFLLRDLAAAQSLEWDRPGQVQHDWAVLRTLDKGMGVAYYRSRMIARLSERVMRAEFNRRMDIFEVQVSRDLPRFHLVPEPAYIAICDMAWNLGGGFLPKWPKFWAAAKAGDWKTCAAECNRKDVSDARNDETRKLFLSAARKA